jgi:hypothetical protein
MESESEQTSTRTTPVPTNSLEPTQNGLDGCIETCIVSESLVTMEITTPTTEKDEQGSYSERRRRHKRGPIIRIEEDFTTPPTMEDSDNADTSSLAPATGNKSAKKPHYASLLPPLAPITGEKKSHFCTSPTISVY